MFTAALQNHDNIEKIVNTELGLYLSGDGGSFYKKIPFFVISAKHLLDKTSCNIIVT